MKHFALLVVAASLVYILGGVPAHAVPTIQFDKTTVDIGKHLAGEQVKLAFPFKNVGDSDLEITKVSGICGCTKAKAAAAKVASGQSSAIEAVFDSTGYTGKLTKPIIVATNDPIHPVVRLEITADLEQIATLEPERLNFGSLKVGVTSEGAVTITPVAGKTFKIVKVEPRGDHVRLREFTNAPDSSGAYTVKFLVVAGSKAGRISERLSIVTDLPGNPTIGFQVWGNVVDDEAATKKPTPGDSKIGV